MKKTKIIDLLLSEDRPTYREIAEKVGCYRSYVEKIADMINKTKKQPIMDFRGLLTSTELTKE